MKKKTSQESAWRHIACVPEPDDFYGVWAWKTDDEDEEGRPIAYLDGVTARVVYVDASARVDPYAQLVINEQLAEFKKNDVRIRRSPQGWDIYYETGIGTLVLETEERGSVGRDAAYIGLCPAEHKEEYLDIFGVKVAEGSGVDQYGALNYALLGATWENPTSDEPTYCFALSDAEIAASFSRRSVAEEGEDHEEE